MVEAELVSVYEGVARDAVMLDLAVPGWHRVPEATELIMRSSLGENDVARTEYGRLVRRALWETEVRSRNPVHHVRG